jgi:NAD(P)H-dependent FMN reductase
VTAGDPPPVPVAVIVGSTRDDRIGGRVGEWFVGEVEAHGGFVVDVIDLHAIDAALPEHLPAGHPARGDYPPEVRRLADRIAAADGFVLVTPEYNHGYPGSLKDAIDLVNAEWRAKPVAYVSYGGLSGGIRAVEQLRQVMVELHTVSIRDSVHLQFAPRAFRKGTVPDDPDGMIADGVRALLRRLDWWARALSRARADAPYDG